MQLQVSMPFSPIRIWTKGLKSKSFLVNNKKNPISCGHVSKVLSPPPPARRRKIGFSGHFTKKTILDAYQNGLDESQFCNKMSSFMIKVTLNFKKKFKKYFFCCWQGVTPFLLTCPQLICLFFIDAFPYLFLYSSIKEINNYC